MAIHFDMERMERVREAHDRWWKGTLNRPLTAVTLTDAWPVERRAAAPLLDQAHCGDFSWSAEQVIERLDEELSRCEFLGDAFPMVNFDAFGPGVLAAFCGARLDNASGGVWFFPEEAKELADIHVHYDPENKWVKRIKELYRAGMERWNGLVILGMPDLGGVMDVAATLRGSENLLMDLYDEPEEVLRLNREIQDAWYAAYQDFAQVLKPQNGFSNWMRLLSTEPSYSIQCDFSYMIGNPMFKQFVLETLREDTERLAHTIYHLDGIGELNHLEDILSLEKLDAVQWVPGDGQPSAPHWLDVYRTIQKSGKGMMIVGSPRDYLEVLWEIHGTPYSVHFLPASQRELAMELINAR